MVVMRGVNDRRGGRLRRPDPAEAFFRALHRVYAGDRAEDFRSFLVPGDTIVVDLARRFPLERVERGALCGPAQEFRIAGAAGTLGLITAMSGHFCGDCNRIRVTASGLARSCLFGSDTLDLKPVLAAGDPDQVEQALRRLVENKPARHLINEPTLAPAPFAMSAIGG